MFALEGWRTDEDDEYTSYDDAVERYDSLLEEARTEGWDIEHGWASRDNMLAARLTRGNHAEAFLAIVRVEPDEDDDALIEVGPIEL